MIYLLDTNIISETAKLVPNVSVIKWLESIPQRHLAISALTIGEIRKGIETLIDVKKKIRLVQWLEIDLAEWFKHRVLDIDYKVADKWGYIAASSSKQIAPIDGLIAASAIVNGLKLVTRNLKDFEKVSGLEVINPFDVSLEATQ